jgi:fibronectin type 3 domain-containing protein
VDSTDFLVTTISSRTTVEFDDRDVAEGMIYAYRVYVGTTSGSETGSNTISALVPNLRPPIAVTLDSISDSGPTRLALSWSRNDDKDFRDYRVYRNETGAVSDEDTQVALIDNSSQTFWDDTGLVENTTYFYRVYATDQGGLVSRSNEVSATTLNEPPPAVALNPATNIGTGSATLSWTESTVHDFASYRLYRDETLTVTTGSTLVVEIDERTGTSFRDTGLSPGVTYYYRVFVVDHGAPDPESTGSNTISFTAQ